MKLGMVGLPNVGKSILLMHSKCGQNLRTIRFARSEPNVGIALGA